MLEPLDNLVRVLSRLPGLGRRSASRVALALLRDPVRNLDPLVVALDAARRQVKCCSCCGAFTVVDRNPCSFCLDCTRDGSIVCVVEDPADIVTIESSGAFRGRYHVLGGKLSPVKKMGPEKLRIAELKRRVAEEGFKEVMLAVSTDMEGDATAGFVEESLRGVSDGVRISRLAFGLPADSGVGYSDPLTLRRAIAYRTPCISI